jgi:hypothetical protein
MGMFGYNHFAPHPGQYLGQNHGDIGAGQETEYNIGVSFPYYNSKPDNFPDEITCELKDVPSGGDI